MFDWIRRALRSSGDDDREEFFATVDAMNAEASGGEPVAITRSLGFLKLHSGTLVISDPQYLPGLEITNVNAESGDISISAWEYPTGALTVTELRLSFGTPAGELTARKVGEVPIDSGKLIVADKSAIDKHWTEEGKDRIGVISTARDDTLLRLLTDRFKLKTRRMNVVRAEVIGPVSKDLEKEIETFLVADPKYSSFPYMHFYVQTNNSFDRANFMNAAWQFIPVGNNPEPLMFVCETGRGDGCYEVLGHFEGDIPRILTITFVEG